MGRATGESVTEGIDAKGLTAIVTGGNSGLGKETVRVLAKRGARVFLAARNLEAATTVKEEILKEIPEAEVDLLKLDLSSFESIRRAAQDFLALEIPLNILVNNAGMMGIPFQLSKDGFEAQFATNYLGQFLFTDLLLSNMKETAQKSGIEGRIVNVSSFSHKAAGYKEGIRFDTLNNEVGYTDRKSYGQSKLAQILWTQELAKRLREEGANVTVNSLHPGVVRTNILQHRKLLNWGFKLLFFLAQNPAQGASTQCYLALSPAVAGVTGKYFSNCKESKSGCKFLEDEAMQTRLWDYTVDLMAASSPLS